jgi:AraC-like DNA-binding protein
MDLIRHRPAPPLDRFIECLWWSHREQPLVECEHMLPSGTAQLIFTLHDTPLVWRAPASADWEAWSGSIVHGPQSGFYLAGPKPRGSSVGVSFRAGGAAAVLGVSMQELADRHVGLDALWGARASVLLDQLRSGTEPALMFHLLERSLGARIRRPLLLHPAIAEALACCTADAPPPARVADIQRRSGYSGRYFGALFRAAVGLNPKQYYRIRRFNGAVRWVAAGHGGGLGDIAAAHGYADQPHLTREFHALAGITPGTYRASAPDRPLHHRGPGAVVSR